MGMSIAGAKRHVAGVADTEGESRYQPRCDEEPIGSSAKKDTHHSGLSDDLVQADHPRVDTKHDDVAVGCEPPHVIM